MTGAYLRVQRDGKWQNIEVEYLTGEERRRLLSGRSMEEVMRWMDMLCERVVYSEKMFNELVEEGILAVKDE